MPELPEVESLRRLLARRLRGRRIVGVRVRETRLRYPLDREGLGRSVRGRGIVGVRRRSKYLILDLEGRRSLLVHLGMSGGLLLEPARAPVASHVHVRLLLENGEELRYRDPRRFGFVEALSRARLDRDPRLGRLGPEPLSAEVDAAHLRSVSRRRRQPVKCFIMDARRLVGVGNIYANEALFLAGIHPRRAAGRVGAARWDALLAAIRRVLEQAIEEGGTTLRDWRGADGVPGAFTAELRVYGRAGEPCPRCERPVRRTVLGGRSTFWCAGCQR